MELHLRAAGTDAVLIDKEDFHRLLVRIEEPSAGAKQAATLGRLGVLEESFAWLSILELRKRGDPDDATWVAKFDAMIDSAKAAGWVNERDGLVRGHVIRAASGPNEN